MHMTHMIWQAGLLLLCATRGRQLLACAVPSSAHNTHGPTALYKRNRDVHTTNRAVVWCLAGFPSRR
jgi:hypothetical protein